MATICKTRNGKRAQSDIVRPSRIHVGGRVVEFGPSNEASFSFPSPVWYIYMHMYMGVGGCSTRSGHPLTLPPYHFARREIWRI